MSQKIEAKSAGKKGLGVFARQPIKAGEVIEVARFLYLNSRDYETVQKTSLVLYIYAVGRHGAGVGLGFASLYNHSEDPNADYVVDSKKRLITYRASRSIAIGEEITIDYGYHPAKPETWGEWSDALSEQLTKRFNPRKGAHKSDLKYGRKSKTTRKRRRKAASSTGSAKRKAK